LNGDADVEGDAMHEASRRTATDVRPGAKKMKSRGHPHAGLHFYVWDEDRRTAAAWAEQLADVERSIEERHAPAQPTA
jgi:hypothetical protein